MIDDMQHMQVFAALASELEDAVRDYNSKANGKTDKLGLALLRLEQNRALVDLLRQHERVLKFMAGQEIEPQTHYGEAMLVGIMGEPE